MVLTEKCIGSDADDRFALIDVVVLEIFVANAVLAVNFPQFTPLFLGAVLHVAQ